MWNGSGISIIVPGGFQRVVPYGMMESMWNPWHSIWNIDGMEAPKWLGSHPKHIPYGMGGIHLE